MGKIARTAGGGMAGSALGDLVFTMFMCKIMMEIRVELMAADLIFSITNPWDPGGDVPMLAIGDISYVDDGFFPINADACVIIAKSSKAMSVIEVNMSKHGLLVHTSAG